MYRNIYLKVNCIRHQMKLHVEYTKNHSFDIDILNAKISSPGALREVFGFAFTVSALMKQQIG